MVARIHDTFYDAKATLLLEADIKEIREFRGRIPNALKKMVNKFHIGPKHVYEIWDNKERLQQGVILSQSCLNNIEVEPSKSINLTLEEGKKIKKSGEKKIKSKSVRISEPSNIIFLDSIQAIPTSESSKMLYSEDLKMFYEKEAIEDEKNKAEIDRLLASL